MNKRDFKKYVESIGNSACASMVDICENYTDVDQEKAANAVEKVISAVAAAKSNADVTFDKGVKAFDSIVEYSKAKRVFFRQLFNKIYEDFYKELEVALKEFNSGVPEEVKVANKKEVK